MCFSTEAEQRQHAGLGLSGACKQPSRNASTLPNDLSPQTGPIFHARQSLGYVYGIRSREKFNQNGVARFMDRCVALRRKLLLGSQLVRRNFAELASAAYTTVGSRCQTPSHQGSELFRSDRRVR